MVEELLIRHCAPTLAGIKTGSVFNCKFSGAEELYACLESLNSLLIGKGLRVIPLRCRDGKALLYAYRPEALRRDLSREGAREILSRRGYDEQPEQCLSELIRRLNRPGEFPHEIGLFLGYPAEDVLGFMEHRECRCAGYWKVYGNEAAARRLFESYKKCTESYKAMYERGKRLDYLSVAM